MPQYLEGACVRIALVSINLDVGSPARALGGAGHDVTVYARRDAPDLPDHLPLAPGVLVRHLDAGAAAPVPEDELLPLVGEFGTALGERLERSPADVIHAHSWLSGLAALAATRVPVVQTFHPLGVIEQRYADIPPARIRMERALARGVARVVATSADQVEELLRMGATRDRIRVLPAGVDVEHFRREGPVAAKGDRPRLLCVGPLEPRQGFDTAIQALPAVPAAELVIAGAGPELGRLVRLAERCGVADRVRLVDAVSDADRPALLRSADLVVCPPAYEPAGIVALEAMACGVPVVASAVGAFLDTVVAGATGALVPPRRSDLLAAALRRLLAEPFYRQAYGAAGADRARSRFAWDRIAADTVSVYEDVLQWEVAGRSA
jgi:glycosyltransferase involved in cell wall biosynthesis